MIIPRDTDYEYTYNPWGNWGRWVLLAIVIIIIIAIIASFFVRSKQHNARPDIPLAPVYPQDPTNGNHMNPPPPMYQPDGTAYMGPVWHGPQQHMYGEKGYGNNYGPPSGPPPADVAGSSSMYGPPPGPPPPSASGASASYYGPPEGAPGGHSTR